MIKWLVFTAGLLFGASELCSQDSTKAVVKPVAAGYINKVSSNASQLEQKLGKHSARTLQQLKKQEDKMRRKLAKIDSLKAKEIFSNSEKKYKDLEERLQHAGSASQYIPSLDTLSTSLKFLQQNPQLMSSLKDNGEKLNKALGKVDGLQDRFQQAEEIKRFLKERKQYLREQLSKFGFAKQLKKINKQVYYYSQQVNEYKALLKDHKKAERKAIEILTKTKLFNDFMKKNSMLASLFPSSGTGMNSQSSQAGFAGLQTRAQINNFMTQAGMSGPDGNARFQENLQNAQSSLDQLRNKLNSIGANGDELEMPGFKPNAQKTKSFFKRLEYGTTIQSQKANSFFPATSDLGLSVGYKLNDKSIIGIGASYKMGLGRGWNNIRLSNQGVGLRSFVDWQLKGSFWLSGGYEQNYKTLFNSIEQLKNFNAWQQSGLLGVSKTVSLKSKFLKKTKLQLLWDFLSYQQVPKTQPVLFRVGYNF
jgi:hypothetical protein